MNAFFHLIDPLVRWLTATPMSEAIGIRAWITPTVQSIHIVAIACVMACMAMLNLRVLGAWRAEEGVAAFSRRYGNWMWPALAVLLLTGSVLIIGEPRRSLENKIFITKMALVLTAAVLTATIQWPLKADKSFWDQGGRQRLAQLIAVVSILVWVAIVFAGRWIAYAQE
jgi:hypothetical protein